MWHLYFFWSQRFYHFLWVGGECTNRCIQLIALWGVFICAKWLGIDDLYIFGDSKGIIKWVFGYTHFDPPSLTN